jgi:hypothetical protein
MTTQESSNNSLIGFIAGPYGVLPQWDAYETLILISASTGASFTLPILESILNNRSTLCTKRIRFLLVVKHRHHINYYAKRLEDALIQAEEEGITLDVVIAITGNEASLGDGSSVNSAEQEWYGENTHDENTDSTKRNTMTLDTLAKLNSESTSTSSGNEISPLDNTNYETMIPHNSIFT